MIENNKKILVLSHNSLDYENANGRSILNLIDYNNSEDVYHISLFPNSSKYIKDKNHLELNELGILFKKISYDPIKITNQKIHDYKNKTKIKFVSILKHIAKNKIVKNLIRNNIWRKYSYILNTVNLFLNEKKPDVIFYQPGDFFGLNRLVNDISGLKKIPIILYITEDYFLKGKKYFKPFGYGWEKYRTSFLGLFKNENYAVFGNEKLKNDYLKVLNVSNSVIYISSDIEVSSSNLVKFKVSKKAKIGYFGNLSLGRHKSIINFSKYLMKEYPNYIITVYSSCKNRNIIKNIKKCKNIVYQGFINYNDLRRVMTSFDFLLLAEAETGKHIKNLKYAFSTKVADYLGLGKNIISIGAKDIYVINYLQQNQCALHFSDIKRYRLDDKKSKDIFNDMIINSKKLFIKNHKKDENQNKMKLIIGYLLDNN